MPCSPGRARTFPNYFKGFSLHGVSSTELPVSSTDEATPSTTDGPSLWISELPDKGRPEAVGQLALDTQKGPREYESRGPFADRYW